MMIQHSRLIRAWSAALMAVCCLVLSSCTKENMEDCNILYVTFRQTINADNVDKFESEVNAVSLFVFNEAGLFVGQYKAEGATLKNNYRMPLRLNPGSYNLYAWGNMDESYKIAPLTVGVSTYQEAKLSIDRAADGVISKTCTPLFHGMTQRVTVNEQTANNATIDMMKNVNFIRVTVKGLPTDNITTKAQDEFMCRIISPNGDYNFDNSLVGTDPLTYIPQYTIQNQEIQSDFSTLRLFEGDATRLIVSYKNKEIYNKSLSELLLENPNINNQQDLDKVHEYSIIITLDGTTHLVTSITINGWTSSGGGVIL